MKVFAEVKNNLVSNMGKFASNSNLPNDWFDVTNVPCNIGWPLNSEGLPIVPPTTYHTVMPDNSDWELTAENAVQKEADEIEASRIAGIEQEKELSGLKKVTVAQAHAKIDQMFMDKTTIAQLRTATVRAFKLLSTFVLK